MRELVARSWWMFAWRGALALLFGVLAAMWPGLTLLWLVAMFAVYSIFAGVAAGGAAWTKRQHDRGWWLIFLWGLVSIAAGIIAIMYPGLTALVLVLLIGANAIVTGVLDIVVAIRLRKVMQQEWLLVLSGVLAVVFGVLVFLFPGAGALALVWLISTYAILTGLLLLALAWRARSWGRTQSTPAGLGAAAHNS
ncbi:MAG TPA: DUF308 domain-containing protein [Burkholderiaceae bacterium]|nr:DUF308 domain-containing protein [Burkholderiaceae bacterium]